MVVAHQEIYVINLDSCETIGICSLPNDWEVSHIYNAKIPNDIIFLSSIVLVGVVASFGQFQTSCSAG